jgi:hypothetical protein
MCLSLVIVPGKLIKAGITYCIICTRCVRLDKWKIAKTEKNAKSRKGINKLQYGIEIVLTVMMCEEENVDMGTGIIICIIRLTICIGQKKSSILAMAQANRPMWMMSDEIVTLEQKRVPEMADGTGVGTPCQHSLITAVLSYSLAKVIEALEFFSDSNPNWSLISAV